MLRISKLTDYAILLMVELTREQEMLSAHALAERIHVEAPTAGKVLKQLASAGLVESFRGANGGYRLARNADEIMVGQIHRLVDGPLAPAPCASVTQYRACDWCQDEATCELKTVWTRVRDAISGVMDTTSLGDLVREGAVLTVDKYAI